MAGVDSSLDKFLQSDKPEQPTIGTTIKSTALERPVIIYLE